MNVQEALHNHVGRSASHCLCLGHKKCTCSSGEWSMTQSHPEHFERWSVWKRRRVFSFSVFFSFWEPWTLLEQSPPSPLSIPMSCREPRPGLFRYHQNHNQHQHSHQLQTTHTLDNQHHYDQLCKYLVFHLQSTPQSTPPPSSPSTPSTERSQSLPAGDRQFAKSSRKLLLCLLRDWKGLKSPSHFFITWNKHGQFHNHYIIYKWSLIRYFPGLF